MKLKGKKVIVQDNNIEKALRKFKKQVNESGILQEVQKRTAYTKPSVARKIAKNQKKLRWKKFLKSQELPKKYF
jgi:small subunit ribosomal protein S21